MECDGDLTGQRRNELDGCVLITFAEGDAAAGAVVRDALARDGWACRAGSSPGANAPVDCIALVLLLSAKSGRSRQLLIEVEFAIEAELPVIPVRLDKGGLAASLEYIASPIGNVNAFATGLPEGAKQVSAALGRIQTAKLIPSNGQQIPSRYSGAPRLRLQPVLRRVLLAGFAVSALLGAAGVHFDLIAMLATRPNYALARWFGDTSGLIGGFTAWFASAWFYFAHRNLVALGYFGSRFRPKSLIWRLVVPPINFIGAAPVIREILAKTPHLQLSRGLFQLLPWTWPLFHLCQWVHTAILNSEVKLASGQTLLTAELVTNLVQCITAPLTMLILLKVTPAHAAARPRRRAGKSVVRSGTTYPVLVSWADGDQITAQEVCDRLDSTETPCRLASRDASWAADAVDLFSAVVLIASSNLEHSEQAFRECQRAFDRGIYVIPIRLDRSPVSARFKDIRLVQWLSDEDASFAEQIDLCRDVVKRVSLPKEPPAAYSRADPSAVVRNRSLGRAGFYAGAGVYAVIAGLCCVLDFAAIGGARGFLSYFLLFSHKLFFFAVSACRASACALCLLGYGIWRFRRRRPSKRHDARWPRLFAASAVAGMLSPFAWDLATAMGPFLTLTASLSQLPEKVAQPLRSVLTSAFFWLWAAGTRISAAAVWDIAASGIGLAMLSIGLQEAVEQSAKQKAAESDRIRAEHLRFRGIYERLRFTRQEMLQRSIGIVGFLSVLFAAVLHAGDAGQHGAGAQVQYITSTAVHLVLIPVPVTVLFLIWVGTAYRNLRALGIETSGLTASRAVLFLAFPFVNICLAAPILDDLVRNSVRAQRTEASDRRLVRGWIFSVVTYWSVFCLRFGAIPLALGTMIIACDVALVSLWAAVCVLSGLLVRRVNGYQHALWSGGGG